MSNLCFTVTIAKHLSYLIVAYIISTKEPLIETTSDVHISPTFNNVYCHQDALNWLGFHPVMSVRAFCILRIFPSLPVTKFA